MGLFNRLLGRSTKGSGATARERLQLILVHDRIDLPPAHLEAMKEEILAVIAKYVSFDSGKVDIALHQRERENMLVAEIPFLKPTESIDIDELVRLPDRDSFDSSSLIVDDEESELLAMPSVDSLNMDVLLWDDDTQRNRAISDADITDAEIDSNDPVFKSKASDLTGNGYTLFDEIARDEQELTAESDFIDDTQRNRAITDDDIAASDIIAANIAANESAETIDAVNLDESYVADTDHGQQSEDFVQVEEPDASNEWSEDPPTPQAAEDVLEAETDPTDSPEADADADDDKQ